MDDLIKEGYRLKQEIDRKTERLREINAQLAEQADFDGKKSAKLSAGDVQVKIALRENEKWDQDKLVKIKDHFDFFEQTFKTEYKPVKKAVDAACAHNEEFKKAVEWARTVTPGAPSVTYEYVGEEVPDAA